MFWRNIFVLQAALKVSHFDSLIDSSSLLEMTETDNHSTLILIFLTILKGFLFWEKLLCHLRFCFKTAKQANALICGLSFDETNINFCEMFCCRTKFGFLHFQCSVHNASRVIRIWEHFVCIWDLIVEERKLSNVKTAREVLRENRN